jgi:hypothetical protein
MSRAERLALVDRADPALSSVAQCLLPSSTDEGRAALAKRCRLDTEDLAQLLFAARRHVPFVQANLLGMVSDG